MISFILPHSKKALRDGQAVTKVCKTMNIWSDQGFHIGYIAILAHLVEVDLAGITLRRTIPIRICPVRPDGDMVAIDGYRTSEIIT